MNERVAVAMSGGVDSSVAAALLVQAGYEVVGLMLRLWSAEETGRENRCCDPGAVRLARKVAAQLGIPFHVLDARDPFLRSVVGFFVEGFREGLTPNPCLACNRHVRWGYLRDHARALGAARLATGHYARAEVRDGRLRLLQAVDLEKDQSYVLSVLDESDLAETLFPIGRLTKAQVRELARTLGLPVADRPDSQDLCFLPNRGYRSFLLPRLPQVFQPGPIVTRSGRLLGEHQGLAAYTIGQRKGIGVSWSQPLYVLEKDRGHNALVVGPAEELDCRSLGTSEVHWVNGAPPESPLRAQVKIRYKAPAVPAQIELLPGGDSRVHFDRPVRGVTPGQAAVMYQDDCCLGYGLIRPEAPRTIF
ncbi:MAG: tRNA 2-thiouridine(34) synthase MnmA [Anaerolineales bacterium]